MLMWLVKPPSLDKYCLGCFCQVVRDGHVFGVSRKVSRRILQLFPFLTIGECIKDRHYVLSIAAGVCGACTILLHTCRSQSGPVLEFVVRA